MFYWIIPLIIGAVLFAIFLYFRVKEKRIIAVIIKGLVSLMFIITALMALLSSYNPNSSFGVFILIGLFFGLLGDIFLDLKFIIFKHEHLYTILGFITFAIGHFFYITGLFTNFFSFSSHILYIIIPLIITAILLVATLLMEKFTAIRYKNMKLFVIIYGLFLFFTTSIYMSAAIQNGWQATTINFMAIGLILFILSDLVLNNTYFAPGCNTPIFVIVNHTLYYAAQFLTAISLLYLL